MFKLFFLFKAKRLAAYFKSKTLAKLLTVLAFMIVFLAVAVGLYFFFVQGFLYFKQDQPLYPPLTLYFYEMFFLILSGIIIFSTLVTCLYSLFRDKDSRWLVSTPGYRYLPKIILINGLISGAWTLLIVILPMVLALRKVFSLAWPAGLFFILISFILLLAALSALTSSLIYLTGHGLSSLVQKNRLQRLTFSGMTIVLVIIILAGSIFIWRHSVNTDLIKLFKTEDITGQTVDLNSIGRLFFYLPSHYLAMTIFSWQTYKTAAALKYFLELAAITLAALMIWWRASAFFLPLWQKFQEGGAVAETKAKGRQAKKCFNFSGGPLKALFYKELLVNSRNGKNVLWFGFLFFIWLMQTAVNFALAHNIRSYQLDLSLSPLIALVLQFVTAVYFISAFVLRFVFPAFSSERSTAWILASAPLNQKKIFWAKYLFYSLIFVIIGLLLGTFNSFSLPRAGMMLPLLINAVLFITALGLSLGAIFPNLETDDPGTVSTTLPGIFLIILSSFYGALGGWTVYSELKNNSLEPLYIFIVASLLATALLVAFTPRIIKNKELSRVIVG